MKRYSLAVALVVWAFSVTAQAQMLLGYDGGGFTLYSIDAGAVSASAIGADSGSGIAAEIELAGGIVYAADTGTNTNLHFIDPATGAVTSTLTLTFPPDGNVLTSLEEIAGTLYAGLTTEGGGETYLATVDLGSGAVTTVGATGIGSPTGGLALDPSSGVLYAVSAGGTGELFTVDIGTGAATSVGQISVGGTTVGTTALEFGPDGQLYALPNTGETIAGNLLLVDPSNGTATNLGDLGFSGLNALTAMSGPAAPSLAVPSLSLPGLLILSLAMLAIVATRFTVFSSQ